MGHPVCTYLSIYSDNNPNNPKAGVITDQYTMNHLMTSPEDTTVTMVTMVFMILVAVMTVLCIILNTIGIYAFFKLPRTPANLVYLHLCITDLIVGIFVTPYSIVILKNVSICSQKASFPSSDPKFIPLHIPLHKSGENCAGATPKFVWL
eukprot:sb/3473590/